MIELRNHNSVFAFPEMHPDAKINISVQRTLRIPDDNQDATAITLEFV